MINLLSGYQVSQNDLTSTSLFSLETKGERACTLNY